MSADVKLPGSEPLPSFLICLPTYNEAQNLPRILKEVFTLLPDARILVIDDNSPDGTGELAEHLAAENPRLSVLHRTAKEGLGKAYLAGFAHALATSDADCIVQMDADLSHPPTRLPALLRAANDADLVIGSRYVQYGGTQHWGMHRKLLSRFGSFYASLWTGLSVRDLTGGFKVWKRDLLARVLREHVHTDGYAFQIEMSFLASRMGARIAEVPILFVDRTQDTSKMTPRIALEAIWKVPLLRWWHRGVHAD